MNDSLHIADLIAKKIKGNISNSEQEELDRWLNASPKNYSLFNEITDSKKQLSKLEVYNSFNKDKTWNALEEELFGTKTISLLSRKFMRVAAIIIPFIVAGTLALFFTSKKTTPTLAEIDTFIKPGSQKALLVLSDGGTIELGEETLSEIADGDLKIINENKALIYSNQKVRSKDLVYNELKTPHGGGYNLELADGTKIWLNAGSSLKFPVTFSDSTRRVFLEGEGYFEVSHNGKPFIVSSGNMDVRVLGTSFNISAYADESALKTTLVEGKVQIEYKNNELSSGLIEVLNPNDQAVIIRSESKITVNEVNTTIYTSWMQGKFEFANESLEDVMKRLARWYDFKYEFENVQAKDFHFTARISNESSISDILEMLELTTNVQFELREQTIVIL